MEFFTSSARWTYVYSDTSTCSFTTPLSVVSGGAGIGGAYGHGVVYERGQMVGYADVSRWRLAFWQPIIYGGGQLCWMTGMAVLGHHGVPRKTAGSADTMGALAAFLKHGGDGLAGRRALGRGSRFFVIVGILAVIYALSPRSEEAEYV